MSVCNVRAIARVAVVGVLSVVPCGAAADNSLSQLPAIVTAAISPESTFQDGTLPPAALPQEPFGGSVRQPTRGPLLEKWMAATGELRIDIDIMAACRAEPDTCESAAAKRVIAIVEEARKRQGRALIGEINRAVNLAITATSDAAQHGVEDKWSSPLMTFTSGRGDCEDYALAKYAALRLAGLAEEDLRLLIVRLPRQRIDHAVVSVRHDGHWLVLDNRRLAMMDVAHLDAMPLFAMRESPRPAVARDEPRPAVPPVLAASEVRQDAESDAAASRALGQLGQLLPLLLDDALQARDIL